MDYKARLTSIERRTRVKAILRYGGTVVTAIGLMFFPVRHAVSSRGGLSAFREVADLGAFVPWGIVVVAGGLLAIGASFLIREGASD